jgi:hypothetical protein
MIQNADDASYENAKKAKEAPFLCFNVHPNELIVDSNEDGFRVVDVRAICATGESSKKDLVGTIGEKGFGFKSVFNIANQVHVQSGFWSFRFEHRKDDDGLGMVIPLWTQDEPLPPNVRTRIKLRYPEDEKDILKNLIAEFERLPETVIFFLERIKRLEMVFHNVNHSLQKMTFEKRDDPNHQYVFIVTQIDERDECTHKYKVVSGKISGLPEDDGRLQREGNDKPDIVLAFPVEPEDDHPSISERGQHVFAFLPLYRQPQIPVRTTLIQPLKRL